MQLRFTHFLRLFLIVASLVTLLFFTGLQMSKDFEQRVIAALDAGDDMATMALLHDQQKNSGKPSAFVYHVTAVVSAKNGNVKAAAACLAKAIEMVE